MIVSLIVAVDLNGGIGYSNQLLCYLPNDLKHFKHVTMNKPIIMGRKTYESIGKPLPNRINVVVSTQNLVLPPEVKLVKSLQQAFQQLAQYPEVCIIGGGIIYKQAMPFVHKIYLTRIAAVFKADTFFTFNPNDFFLLTDTYYPKDSKHPHAFRIMELQR